MSQTDGRNPYLCLTIVVILGTCLIIGMSGIVYLGTHHLEVPPSLTALTAAAFGSLSSFLVSPPRGSVGVNQHVSSASP